MDLDDARLELKRDFTELLENKQDAIDELAKASEDGAPLRLHMDMNELYDYQQGELHRRVLSSPTECIPPFREALEEQLRCVHVSQSHHGHLAMFCPPNDVLICQRARTHGAVVVWRCAETTRLNWWM